ncbi:hypothetical protein NDJ28_15740, partial [Vibrio alginolyticus]|uniref:hypothetical protein n=1 Tax=Vibrio alginolyticus TaxID=663 RepID=UPI0021607BE8
SAYTAKSSAANFQLVALFPRMGINLERHAPRNPVPLIFSWFLYSHVWESTLNGIHREIQCR